MLPSKIGNTAEIRALKLIQKQHDAVGVGVGIGVVLSAGVGVGLVILKSARYCSQKVVLLG